MSNNVSNIPLEILENDLHGGALQVLKTIRPSWCQEDVTFKMLTDGITNKLIGCSVRDDEDKETVLIRIYGNKTDMLIDRKAETRNIILLNKVALAPKLFATFTNGLAYEYVPGCTLSPETVTQPHIYKLVAVKLAQFHKVSSGNGPNIQPMLWNKLESFLDLVPEEFSDVKKQERFQQMGITKSDIRPEIDLLRHKLSNLGSPVVFAHNDLLLGNVIYTKERNSVTFIDFEYAAMNYQAYDIGNHFAEFIGIENVNFSNYPDKELQLKWFSIYLKEFSGGKYVERKDLERLYVQVNKFALAAHLLWGIWALIQAEHSHIDFDFFKFAEVKIGEYFTRKDEFLSLELPNL